MAVTAGMRYAEYPRSWKDNSERNAPTRPTKFAGGCEAPVVKNHTGSVGSCVTSEISQMSASANSATPTNSLIRRDNVDSGTGKTQISIRTGSTRGLRPVRLLKYRRSSMRSFSVISP